MGLGLAITERAVRFHGGRVSAFNRPEGGLMVEIRLPLIVSELIAPKSNDKASVAQNREQGSVARAQ